MAARNSFLGIASFSEPEFSDKAPHVVNTEEAYKKLKLCFTPLPRIRSSTIICKKGRTKLSSLTERTQTGRSVGSVEGQALRVEAGDQLAHLIPQSFRCLQTWLHPLRLLQGVPFSTSPLSQEENIYFRGAETGWPGVQAEPWNIISIPSQTAIHQYPDLILLPVLAATEIKG